MNIGAPWPDLYEAEARVLAMQTKLHQWATADPGRRFEDLYNLVHDPTFLVVAWNRVRGNKGARSAGVNGVTPRSITLAGRFLTELRDDLKARRFQPVPVREKAIPKAPSKVRRLGIPTVADRVVQASLKLVLEPIFEADFKPCSYGFVRHEAPYDRVGCKDPPSACRSRSLKAGGSLTLEAQGRVGAASTTTGRVGTTRRLGPG